jgi:hypothetical protein
MALVPSLPGAVATGALQDLAGVVNTLRSQLAVVRSALASRDSWESAAAAHEAAEMKKDGLVNTPASVSKGGTGKRGGPRPPRNSRDLAIKPISNSRVPRPPRSIANQIVWAVDYTDLSPITVSTSAIVETNYSFTAGGSFSQFGTYAIIADQYFLYEVSITFRSLFSPAVAGQSPVLFYTAIDLDNTSNLGSVSSIEDFSTCQVRELGQNAKVTRSVRPTCRETVGTYNAALTRQWIDTANSAVPFFGIRSIAGISNGVATYTIIPTIAVTIAFRNQV